MKLTKRTLENIQVARDYARLGLEENAAAFYRYAAGLAVKQTACEVRRLERQARVADVMHGLTVEAIARGERWDGEGDPLDAELEALNVFHYALGAAALAGSRVRRQLSAVAV